MSDIPKHIINTPNYNMTTQEEYKPSNEPLEQTYNTKEQKYNKEDNTLLASNTSIPQKKIDKTYEIAKSYRKVLEFDISND